MDNHDEKKNAAHKPVSRREAIQVIGAAAVSAAAGFAGAPLEAAEGGKMEQAPELCFKNATELARRIRKREVSAKEVVSAHLRQIERVNPQVNAICTLLPEQALEAAEKADRTPQKGSAPGALHGLPIAIKDLVLTKGIRTTFGSRIYKNFIPDQDALIVERLKAAGAIIIGKANTPEFGAGSQTFNEVFGETRNPYDLTKTCGGSSGGGAVSLACGMMPIADGSDMGGSLRNPPNFCNVVGLRPSPGRVPEWPSELPWDTLSVSGPMARTVEDVALLMSVMAGPDPRSPISIEESPAQFLRPLDRDFKGVKVAWSRDLGHLPVEPAVVTACEGALGTFRNLGCVVEEDHPDFSGGAEAFQVLRAWVFAAGFTEELNQKRDLIKDTVIWNTEQGLKLSGQDVANAEKKRGIIYDRVRRFLEKYQFLILPVSQVAPFPIEVRWVREINGVPMHTYIDWMASCYYITLTGLPAISVPCGFAPGGLPVGIQIVGRNHGDFEVLQLAHAFEKATGIGKKRPAIAF